MKAKTVGSRKKEKAS